LIHRSRIKQTTLAGIIPKHAHLGKRSLPGDRKGDVLGKELLDETNLISPDVRNLKIIRHFDRIEINPGALDRDWCWLSVKYGFGNSSITLQEILNAGKEGQRYLSTPSGWVDAQSHELIRDLNFRIRNPFDLLMVPCFLR